MSKGPDKRGFTQQGRGSGAPRGRGKSRGATPARTAALDVLRVLREREAFAQDVVDKRIDEAPMSPEDRAFATKLVMGVVSARGTLDEVLNSCMRSPNDVDAQVRDALRISTYEIIFLQKSPHAAVDQGVELVRSIAPRAGGVANAILRKVVAAKPRFPFGDPRTDIAAYARLHAFPLWLAQKAVADLGPEKAQAYLKASNEQAPLYVGLNAARANEAEVLEVLEQAGGAPEQAVAAGREVAGCYRLESGRVLQDGRVKRLIARGELLVSDAASQAVANLVLPDEKPGSLLEIGAGRGTKTILLQSDACRRWGSQIGEYVTLDNHGFKTELLRERAEAYGVEVSEALTGDACRLDKVLGERCFDAVFIDAPCTGLGTLRRHPEIKWRVRPEIIEQYAETGLRMLKAAAAHVAEGGTLAYATCTITDEENAGVVRAFLESPEGADFKLVPVFGKASFATSLEPGGSDAHFAVKMVKLGKKFAD